MTRRCPLNRQKQKKEVQQHDGVLFITHILENSAGKYNTAVSDLQSAKKAAAYFYDKGVQKVLITLGSRGVFVSSDGREEIVPAFKVDAVDTTGAGDAFNGGLLAALAEGKDIWEAVRFANGLAALSVQKLGTTPSMPSRGRCIPHGAFLMYTVLT